MSALKDLVKSTFAEDGDISKGMFSIKYIDLENDPVSISDDEDLSVAYQVACVAMNGSLKLSVTARQLES
jgi:hypothetical protein